MATPFHRHLYYGGTWNLQCSWPFFAHQWWLIYIPSMSILCYCIHIHVGHVAIFIQFEILWYGINKLNESYPLSKSYTMNNCLPDILMTTFLSQQS